MALSYSSLCPHQNVQPRTIRRSPWTQCNHTHNYRRISIRNQQSQQAPTVHLDYDATACYDRIILPMVSLISRAHGQHHSIVLINATTLKSVRYLLKTLLGISSTSYSHSQLFPIYGSRQGSGNSPGLWCAISSVLFDVYEQQACGASFYSPNQTIAVKLYMIGFVDDTSGSTNDFLLPEPAPLHHYANLATHDAQQWNNT